DEYRIKKYDGVLWSNNDSFYVKETRWTEKYSFSVLEGDTIDLGTDGYEGAVMTVWTDSDTLRVPYVNVQDKQWLFIKIASPTGSTTYRLRYNEPIYLPDENEIKKYKDSTHISVPMVYELANVALYLSSCSDSTFNKPKTKYAKEVETYFMNMKSHPLITALNNKCNSNPWTNYYGFRENSICYNVDKNGLLKFNTPYKYVYFDESYLPGGEFGNLLFLVQDFLQRSNFISFYKSHLPYYNQLCERQKKLLPVKQMWNWLETEFPMKYDFYNIIFSPLIDGSHSTQRFSTNSFKECVMFINSLESMDENHTFPEKLKEGLMSGIVFTEIDHNYVNPTSELHYSEIKKIFNNKDAWATKNAQQNYGSVLLIFNEYMTHALFCLYTKEVYDNTISEQIIKKRNQLMIKRGFNRFEEYSNLFLTFMKDRKSTVSELYPLFLEQVKKM
ncbi:MAG: hypothetical protein RLZZ546_218, partial [Bacteroidota bacterium]